MKSIHLAAGLLVSVSVVSPAHAQVFTPLDGDAPIPTGVSSDGAWVSGVDRNGSFRWSPGTGLQTFAALPFGDPDIALGGVPVAYTAANSAGRPEAVLWTPSGVRFLGILGGLPSEQGSFVYDASDDGSVVVGVSTHDTYLSRAFRWDPVQGMVDLSGSAAGSSQAFGVSADGDIVVGAIASPFSSRRPALWSGGVSRFLADSLGEARATTPDGSVIVGQADKRIFRWTAQTGAVNLGTVPGSPPIDTSIALGVSDDGDTLVGWQGSTTTPFVRAVLWRPGAGVVELEGLVAALGIAVPAGFPHLREAKAVSADGRTIVGSAGGVGPAPIEGWVLELPPVAMTYCTGKVNSQGCLTAIDTDGTPSASSGAGFGIGATNLVPGAKGVLFYGTSGAAATPFQGGFLCVATPTVRTAVQDSGGAAPCSGSFAFDFNAYVATGLDSNLVGGADVWAQYWSRDPASPSTTNLTDAVTFTLWP